MPRVTTIPATRNLFTSEPINQRTKRRVAGYARVSTDSDEQFTSYTAQVEYYTEFITSNPEWEFVGVYTDEGISALSTKNREGFNQMISDALDRKIDLIVTKSVSRSARNTVDSLSTIRKLKDAGCECYFEKENIYTFDGKGVLLLTIMSSLAQEESRSISENVTWGQRKRFADGKVSLAYKSFLGYERGEDDKPKIVEEEAKIVRQIYQLFLEGKTATGIAKYLTDEKIPTPMGKTTWCPRTIKSILENEKYKGDALLQKKFTVDFLQKKTKKNEGEVPQYYVEGSHEAIIDPDQWEMVQLEIARRKALNRRYSGRTIFSSKIVCGDCGGFYGSKLWHSNMSYRRYVWECNSKVKGETKCKTPAIDTPTIKEKFMEACNHLMADKAEVVSRCNKKLEKIGDLGRFDKRIEKLRDELNHISDLVDNCVQENATVSQQQDEYEKRYSALEQRYNETLAKLQKINNQKTDLKNQERVYRLFLNSLEKQPTFMKEWSDTPWITLLEEAVVHKGKKITFRFKDGTEITREFIMR